MNPSRNTIKRLRSTGRVIDCPKCRRPTMRLDQARQADTHNTAVGSVVQLRLWVCIVEKCGYRETTKEVREGETRRRSLPEPDRRSGVSQESGALAANATKAIAI